MDIVFDSSGIKFYGPGEWQRRKHGMTKRRKWRKVHVAIDGNSQMVLVGGLSEQTMHDSQVMPLMLDSYSGEINDVLADGAYDTIGCYESIFDHKGKPIIPPRKGARSQNGDHPALVPRDQAIDRIIWQKRGKRRWKKEIGYHRRSLVETMFSRLKGIMGDRLNNRIFKNQATEVFVRLAALNRMTELGMPERDKIAA